MLLVGLLAELVCIVDLRREVVIRRIAALLPASKDDESVHGQKPGLKRQNSEDKAFRGNSEGVKSKRGKGGLMMGEGARCAKEMEKSRLSQAEVTTVKVKDEWLNMLFATFWQTYGPWASQYVAAQLEYWITDLGLEVEYCSVGTVPLAIKSTRGYPQAKFSRHEGRGDSEFHSDPELTFDLDLDIELISDLRIKLSYQVTLPLLPFPPVPFLDLPSIQGAAARSNRLGFRVCPVWRQSFPQPQATSSEIISPFHYISPMSFHAPLLLFRARFQCREHEAGCRLS